MIGDHGWVCGAGQLGFEAIGPADTDDPALFVDRCALVAGARRCGVELQLTGLRVSALDYLAWLAGRRSEVRMLPTRSTAGIFQASGRKT